jgi:hypothetical protein
LAFPLFKYLKSKNIIRRLPEQPYAAFTSNNNNWV